jgi:hypothetical protein
LKDRQYNGPDQDEKTNNGPQSTSWWLAAASKK